MSLFYDNKKNKVYVRNNNNNTNNNTNNNANNPGIRKKRHKNVRTKIHHG